MAQQSIQELQRSAILRMLSLGSQEEQPVQGNSQTWKVLVYDKFCQDVIAPLLKVGGLMKHGVTLHLSINNERQPVEDTPAVYFVEPTEANIKRIGEDLKKGLYPSCYINFASAVNRPCLEELARSAMKANATQKVAAVLDRYVSFVSMSASLFSLNLPAAYEFIHSPMEDEKIQQYIERIVDGILSVLITTRSLPVIRCPPGEAAEMVGRRLDERIRELLRSAAGAELFSGERSGAGKPSLDGGSAGRPLLCILDRDADLVTMLAHPWSYQAMAHDVLGMRLNKISVPIDEGAKSSTKLYDVSDSDSFWVQHAAEPWPEAAAAASELLEDFNKKRADMDSKGGDPGDGLAPGLAAAINALPEMTEKKRLMDMHTNIATAILNEVKSRALDTYVELEDSFSTRALTTSIKALEDLFNDAGRGNKMDKTRALMVLYLTKPSMTAAQQQGLADGLRAMGGDATGLAYLQYLATVRNMTPGLAASGPAAAPAGGAFGGLAGNLGGSLMKSMSTVGANLIEGGMSGIKNIVASKKELPVCKIVDALMEHKQSDRTDNFIYLDPKLPPAGYGAEQPRVRTPFRKCVTFVVGGGNYVEAQSLQEWAQEKGRSVQYGSTDLVSPTQFVEELGRLGQAHNSTGSGAADLR